MPYLPAKRDANGDRIDTEIWLNLGRNNEQGEFIKLTTGMPLDTMPRYDTTRNGPATMAESNSLIDTLLSEISDLAPGEEREIKLTVKVHRIKPYIYT